MPWFRRKPDDNFLNPLINPYLERPDCIDRPNDPDGYPTKELRDILRMVPDAVSQRLAEEEASLSQLGLSIPRQCTRLRFRPTFKPSERMPYYIQDVRIHPPTFSIPSHLFVAVLPGLTYTLNGDQKYLTSAKNDLVSYGVIYFLEHYPGVWTNRDPYSFYIGCNRPDEDEYSGIIHYAFREGKFPDDWRGGPLTPMPAPSIEAIRTLEHRINFMLPIDPQSYRYKVNISRALEHIGAIYNIDTNHEYLFGSKLPYPAFPTERTSFKILPGSETPRGVTAQWFESLRRVTSPICFEVRNEPESLYYLLTVAKQDAPTVEQHFELYFPDFTLLPHEPSQPPPPFHLSACPKHPHTFIKEASDFALDPYTTLFHLFESGQHTEALQIFCVPFKKEVLEDLFDRNDDFFEETIKGLDRKTTPWLMALKLYTDDKDRLQQFKQTFLSQFEAAQQTWQFSSTEPPALTDYAIPHWNIVSSLELASLAHFPGREIQSERLETANMKAKLPPESYTIGPVTIGESEARGIKKQVTLPASVRDRHVYIVGKSGTGKSTLITNAVIANMRAGEGVCVIDPHGDLVATGSQPLLDYVPEERIKDTIYFNAADKEYPLALNMLSAGKDEELSLLADNLLVMFRRQSDGWGPRMEDILRATLQTLMHTPGSTFLDIKRLLHNDAFR
jgi:Type IV secretion-system coupling protein DNA-binding domain